MIDIEGDLFSALIDIDGKVKRKKNRNSTIKSAEENEVSIQVVDACVQTEPPSVVIESHVEDFLKLTDMDDGDDDWLKKNKVKSQDNNNQTLLSQEHQESEQEIDYYQVISEEDENELFPHFNKYSLNLMVIGKNKKLNDKLVAEFVTQHEAKPIIASFIPSPKNLDAKHSTITVEQQLFEVSASEFTFSLSDVDSDIDTLIELFDNKLNSDLSGQFQALFFEKYIDTNVNSRVHYCFYVIDPLEDIDYEVLKIRIKKLSKYTQIIPIFFINTVENTEYKHNVSTVYQKIIEEKMNIAHLDSNPNVLFIDQEHKLKLINKASKNEKIMIKAILGSKAILNYNENCYDNYRKANFFRYAIKFSGDGENEFKEKIEHLRTNTYTCLKAAAQAPKIREELEKVEKEYDSVLTSSYALMESEESHKTQSSSLDGELDSVNPDTKIKFATISHRTSYPPGGGSV